MTEASAGEALALIQLIAGVNKRLEQVVGARLKPAGVPIEQFRVLKSLERNDGQTMGDLAAHIFVDQANLTKIIDRIIPSGAVYRAPDSKDRRKVLVFLSDVGRAMLDDLRILVEDPDQRLVEGLQHVDCHALRGLLENLLL